ncbi:MAG: DNA polymerase IV [bacterium]
MNTHEKTPVQRSDDKPLMLYPFPIAIIHMDADAFFAAVEQSINPALKGRPVVTGKERGIIACASYEAKALGVKRGLALHEARRMCPGLVVLPSDYETYSIYSMRMFNIVRRYTPMVEESSIDEVFADLTGMRRLFRTSYEQIAMRIKEEVKRELDITVSIGLSVSKSLAKLASKIDKPDGLTVVPGTGIHMFLRDIPVGDVWGIGPGGKHLLEKFGVKTAYDFVCRPEQWVSKMLCKPGRDIWNELRGNPAFTMRTGEPAPQASISKAKTFDAPSRDKDFVYAKLIRNVESAFIKLRRHKLKTLIVGVMLRRQNYDEEGLEAKLNRPTSATQEAIPLVHELFDHIYRAGAEYRSTMVFLSRLSAEGDEQMDLFEDRLQIEKMRDASKAIDNINGRFGKHSVSIGTSLFLKNGTKNDRSELPARKENLLPGETKRQRLGYPRIMLKV